MIASSAVDRVGNNRAREQLFFGADFTLYDAILSILQLQEIDLIVSWRKGTFLQAPDDVSNRVHLVDKATLIASVGIGKTIYIIQPTELGFPFKDTLLQYTVGETGRSRVRPATLLRQRQTRSAIPFLSSIRTIRTSFLRISQVLYYNIQSITTLQRPKKRPYLIYLSITYYKKSQVY